MSKSIYRQNEEYFEELRDYVIAYVQFVKSGGCVSEYTDKLTDKTIDIVMKIKANRDYVNRCMNYPEILYDQKGCRI